MSGTNWFSQSWRHRPSTRDIYEPIFYYLGVAVGHPWASLLIALLANDKRKCRDCNLRDAAKAARIAIPVKNLQQGPRVGRCTTRIVSDLQ